MSAREGPIYIGPSSSEMGIFELLRLIGVHLVNHGCVHIMQSSIFALRLAELKQNQQTHEKGQHDVGLLSSELRSFDPQAVRGVC